MFLRVYLWPLLALFILGCQPQAEHEVRRPDLGGDEGKEFTEESAPVLTQGEHRFAPRAVEPPPVLYKLGRQDIPEYQNQEALKKAQIDIQVNDFILNIDQSTMEVQVKVVDSAEGGKVLGQYFVKGGFDKSSEDWQADLEPMDKLVRSRNRIHVKAICLLPFVCDQIVMDVRYRKDGKIFKKQFQTKIKPAHIAQGDGEGELIEVPNRPDLSTEGLEDKAIEIPGEMQLPPPENEVFREDRDQGSHQVTQVVTSAPQPSAKDLEAQNPRVKEKEEAPQGSQQNKTPVRPVKEDVKKQQNESASGGSQRGEILPVDQSLVAQAKGWHDRGRLVKASVIPLEGVGFRRRHDSGAEQRLPVWSTDFLKNLVEDVGQQVHQTYPNRSLLVGAVSGRYGGKLGRHASHQTGLDVDIYYQKTDGTSGVFNAVRGGKLVQEFDVQSNWEIFKLLVSHPQSATMVIFVDRKIKNAMCDWAKEAKEDFSQEGSVAFQTLRRLVHWDGHANHFHVRLVCPNGPSGVGCAATRVSLPNGTGCR